MLCEPIAAWVSDERFAALNLVVYVPAPETGTREKMQVLLPPGPEALSFAS